MSVSPAPMVDSRDITSLVGLPSFDRGQAYARQRAAGEVRWHAEELRLTGKVQGTAGASYSTYVQFRQVEGSLRPVFGTCSCPVQQDCKHVAALLLTSNRQQMEATAQQSAPRRRAAPAWEQQLNALIGPPADTASAHSSFYPGGRTAEPVSLALQFELRETQDRVPSRWRAPGRPWELETLPRIRLGVRPVRQNANGKWVRGQTSWDSVRYSYHSGRFQPAQAEWLKTFAAVHEAGHPSYSSNDAWLHLDDFTNPLLWQLLAGASEAGIELVSAKTEAAVVLADPVSVSLDVQAGPDGLQLRPRAEVDGEPLNPAAMGVIGNPGQGLFWWNEADTDTSLQARAISVAPTTEPVGDALRTLITGRVPLQIPGSGRGDFLGTYYPQLRQQAAVASSDGSVELPELVPPQLVLRMVHVPDSTGSAGASSGAGRSGGRTGQGSAEERQPGPGRVETSWQWEYRSGGRSERRPLIDDGTGYRDHRHEAQILAEVRESVAAHEPLLAQRLPHPASGHPGSNRPLVFTGVSAARFTTDTLPELAALEQLQVEVEGPVPDYTELTETPQVGIRTSETNDGDWFDLGVTVTVAGTEIPFDQLFRALAAGEEHLMLANGHYFELDQPEFLQLRRLIEEARSLQEREDGLRISRYQAGLWDELTELAATAEQTEAWRRSVTGLLNLTEVPPTPVPAGLRAKLRPYQQEGFSWLAFLWEHGLGGVLADDMGLGKTLQTLALICHAAAAPDGELTGGRNAPFLVVAPTSVVPNWAAEAGRFAPGLRTVAITDTLGRSGADPAALAEDADIVVVSYTLFRLDYEAYAAQRWSGLVLDEAQFVKNRATKASQNARRFPAAFKLAITGTPMENNLMELWSLFAITAPGLFPSSKTFADYYQKPVEKDADTDRLAQLRRRIRPLLMRRTKEAVATELPPKQEQILELDLAPRHRTIYQRHLQRERQKVLGLLEDMNKNRFAIFKSLTTLRMLSLDPSLVDEKYASAPSSKLDALFEQLEDIVAEGHRALIFSQFTSFLGKAAERLDAAGVEYAYLDGSTRRRGEVIEKFKNGSAPVFLISLKAGGVGLNLTEADYCFLLDPWWNPATENQAVDRTHRIGQTKNVMVYRLVAKDTIEEKVMALKEKKAKLFASVLDDDAMFSSALSAADVRGLFEA